MLELLCNKINTYILNLENNELLKQYDFFKQLVQSNIINYNFYEEHDVFSILFSFIISNKKYKSLDEIIRVYNRYKQSFIKLDIDELNLFYTYLVCCELGFDSYDILRENGKDYTELFEAFNQALKIVPDEVLLLIYHLKLFDYNKQQFIDNIYDDMINNDIIKKSEQKGAKAHAEKRFKTNLKSELSLLEHQKELDKNLSYMNYLDSEVKKINKNINKAKQLLNILNEVNSVGEIKNINYILKNTPEELKIDVLKYILNHNLEYYKILEEEYNSKTEHSVRSYVSLLYKYKINYNNLNKETKAKILSTPFIELKQRFEELKKVISINNIEAVLFSNENIIDYFCDCISQGIISKKFINKNIEILFDPIKSNKSLFDLFNLNKEIISKKLNIKNLNKESYDVFLGNTNLIVENLELLESEEIKINRNLRNYLFLISNNLKDKIIEFKKLNIDINKNLYLLNADNDIIKRIKVCNLLNIDIYDSNNKIKDEILFKEKFMLSDDMINNYLNEREKYKTLLYKI